MSTMGMMDINKKIGAVSALSTILLLAVIMPFAVADEALPCEEDTLTGDIDNNIEVIDECMLGDAEGGEAVTIDGNVELDDDDTVELALGTINGNIEAKDCASVTVAAGTSMNGNIKAEGCSSVTISGTITSNVEVKDGDLTINDGAVIDGNVKHEGSGTCTINGEPEINGNREGGCEPVVE